jgi:hypothetical protein
MKSILRYSFCLGIVVLAPARASADSPTEARLRDALRTSTQQLRALEDERTHWQATDATQKKEIESLKAELAAQSQKLRAQGAWSEAKRQLAEQTEANQKLTESLTQCQTAARETEEVNRSKDAERQQLAAKQAAQVTLATNQAKACEEKNERMYELSRELLVRCEKVGVGDPLTGLLEPFTGLRKVKLENLSQEYEDKLMEQKVQP